MPSLFIQEQIFPLEFSPIGVNEILSYNTYVALNVCNQNTQL